MAELVNLDEASTSRQLWHSGGAARLHSGVVSSLESPSGLGGSPDRGSGRDASGEAQTSWTRALDGCRTATSGLSESEEQIMPAAVE